jgi:hypothetical protein
MELTVRSKMSAFNIQTPGKYPEENLPNMVIGFAIQGFPGFVCEFLYVGTRLTTPPYFLLLQNPQVSLHYHLCLYVG